MMIKSLVNVNTLLEHIKFINNMKEKIFKFRIVEVTEKVLKLDGGEYVIDERTHFELYQKVPWIIGNWFKMMNTGPDGDIYDYYDFETIEEAKNAAIRIVRNYVRETEYEETAKAKRKELKTTVKIICGGEISTDNPYSWRNTKK